MSTCIRKYFARGLCALLCVVYLSMTTVVSVSASNKSEAQSQVGITFTDEGKVSGNETNGGKGSGSAIKDKNPPKTGDTSGTYFYLAILTISFGGIVLITIRKSRKEKHQIEKK